MKLRSQKIFSLRYLLEPLEEDPTFLAKGMFGGLAVYYRGKMVLCLMESPGERSWKGEDLSFDLWNGILIPTDRSHHPALLERWPGLVSHPVLGKWLYLPMTDASFETTAEEVIREIARENPSIGIEPKKRVRKRKK